MRKISIIAFAALIIFCAGCSHNPAVFTIGKQVKLGTTEYGEISYINGIAIVDCSRENSSWEMEIDDNDGIQYDQKTGTVKGIRKIRRTIGRQVTGYLVDLAKVDKYLAVEYVKENAKENTKEE
ncbi:MAG: hypothetical protein IJS08_09630 [Victivallales bacterium]|nr:hypothetical protein [Victivallales bacterium]